MAPIKISTISKEETTETVSIVQLARKRSLMRSIELQEYTLAVTPSDKRHIRDAPRMECASLKKMYNRSALAASIREGYKLRIVDASQISDRSEAMIPFGMVIKFNERHAFLHALLFQVEQFYERVLTTVHHIHSSSIETAKYVRANTPIAVAKVQYAGSSAGFAIVIAGVQAGQAIAQAGNVVGHEFSEVGKEIVVIGKEIVEAGKETAVSTKVAISSLASSGVESAGKAKINAQGVLSSGRNNVADFFEAIVAKGKKLVSYDREEILVRRSAHASRLTNEAAIYRAYAELLREIEHNRQDLTHVLLSEMRDRSKPQIMSNDAMDRAITKHVLQARTQVMAEVRRASSSLSLKSTSTRDASAPILAKDIAHVQNDSRRNLLADIECDEPLSRLSAAIVSSDRSAPVLPTGGFVQLDKIDSAKKSLLTEVLAGIDLAHNSPRLIKDRSAPMVAVSSPGLGSM